MEQRANIKFCFKLGKTAAETVELMRQVYRDNCLSRAQIFRWYARFKRGVETTEDEATSCIILHTVYIYIYIYIYMVFHDFRA